MWGRSKYYRGNPMWGLALKVALGSSIVALGSGFYAGMRWEKGAQYDKAVLALTAMETQAAEGMTRLNDKWELEAQRAQIQVEEWGRQTSVDNALIRQILIGQADIRSQFDEFEREIIVTTNFGECTFSGDAIRLLRQSGEAARPDVPSD